MQKYKKENKNHPYSYQISTFSIFYAFLSACCQVASVVSDSVQPHGLQPTMLLRPWDSPGKNTGVGCHFLLQCMKVESESEVTQSCPTLSDPMDGSLPGSSVHGIFRATVLEWGAIAFSHFFLDMHETHTHTKYTHMHTMTHKTYFTIITASCLFHLKVHCECFPHHWNFF